MDKATYSISALKQCKELIRKSRWSTRLKAEHNSRCAEVNVLFASCQNLLNYVMFQPESALPASFRTEEHTNTYTCKIVYGKPHSNKPKQVPDKCLASL